MDNKNYHTKDKTKKNNDETKIVPCNCQVIGTENQNTQYNGYERYKEHLGRERCH